MIHTNPLIESNYSGTFSDWSWGVRLGFYEACFIGFIRVPTGCMRVCRRGCYVGVQGLFGVFHAFWKGFEGR